VHFGGEGRSAKKAVMCAAHAGKGAPTFNKYAGVQEFSDAALLFVNLFVGPGGEPPRNAFLSGGKLITWFGADKAHDHSSAILRLKHHRTGYSLSEDGKSVVLPSAGGSGAPPSSPPLPVALAVRLAPELPYVYLGELAFEAHTNPGRTPVAFTWRLKHFEQLAAGAALKASSSAAASQKAALAASELPEQSEADEEGELCRGASQQLTGLQGRSRFAAVLRAGGVSAKELAALVLPPA